MDERDHREEANVEQRPFSVLHYPGQAKPWKYVHLFSSEGLLAITQRYKSDSKDTVAVERRVLIYNIDISYVVAVFIENCIQCIFTPVAFNIFAKCESNCVAVAGSG